MGLRSCIHAFCAATVLLATPLPCPAQTAADFMTKDDVFNLAFEANRALNYYLQALALAPENVSLLLRIAR